MKAKLITLTAILIILVAALALSLITLAQNTDAQLKDDYSYTKAICDDKVCQDYVISCSGATEIAREPITGAAIAIPNGWSDPRSSEAIEGFCNLSGEKE